MQLNTVVLPAPFGPISAVMSPRAAEKERSSTATSPPKRIERCSTRSTGAGRPAVIRGLPSRESQGWCGALVERGRLACADEAARLPDHDQHHGEAEDQHAILRRIEVFPENVFQEIELAHDL